MSRGGFSAEHRESQSGRGPEGPTTGKGGHGSSRARSARTWRRPAILRKSTSARFSGRAAVCQRSRGPWRDTSSTIRSSAGGVIGCDAEIGGGSVLHDRGDQRRLARPAKPCGPSPSRRARAEREDVGPRIGLLPLELLRRHVLERAEDRALLRQVRLLRRQRESRRTAASAGASAFARPKSRSFTPDFVSITLPGFRSRCTIPCRCAFSSASAISTPKRSTCSSGSGPCASRSRQRLPLEELHDEVLDRRRGPTS